ncbi:multidrug ABC transporter substrate-binding protein [Chryseobacterium piperi]|uniref:Multidrug ABC transporter substrate-binding protein n=1 Tax=Chryseobacterium piperi TaxID=558152 RepID=A0A086BKX2_9FLAO|nr:ABC transporter permease [Chryseobacterium piperi]ASW74427.1 multidrug ABC transporter substrate-binding protein [Chryseobacterium piperi]KFF29586.1 multidrug ABC transporter substrate-binding protein [Chryseobacterium piperi]
MNVSNLFRIAWRALLRNKLRAFLTMLGIIIGVASVIAMTAIGEGSKKSISDQLSSMGSNMITIRPSSNINVSGGARIGASGLQTLKPQDAEAISKGAPDVSYVSPAVQTNGQSINGPNNWPTQLQGVNVDYFSIRDWAVTDGSLFTTKDVTSSNKVCLLGQTVITNLFPNGEEPVGSIIRFNKVPMKVIGVLAPKGSNAFGQDQDDVIIAPFNTVQRRFLGITYVQTIYASSTNENTSQKATDEVSEILRKQHKLSADGNNDDFSVRTQAELISTMSSTSQLLTVLLSAIAGISLVVGGIGIMNIMYVSVTERTKEIGLRMSIGARGKDILYQFLIEAILISITGGIIGVILGVLTSKLVTQFLSWPTYITESSIIISFIVCAITGVFFGYYPALKASKLDPIEALRYE